jgi:hypothetical protein
MTAAKKVSVIMCAELEPLRESVAAAVHLPQGERAQQKEAAQLYQRLKGHRDHEAVVPLLVRDGARTEQYREHGDGTGEHQAQALRCLRRDCIAAEPRRKSRHDLDLRHQQRHRGDEQAECRDGADLRATVTECEQVGERGELEATADAPQRHQQKRREQEHHAHADGIAEVTVAEVRGYPEDAEQGPGAGDDAQRQRVDQRVRGDRFRDEAAIGGPGYREQQVEVGDAGEQYRAEIKSHRPAPGRAREPTRRSRASR